MEKNFEGRLKTLNDKIDNSLGVITGNYTNFTEKFTAKNYLRLKSTLSDINNVLTLKLTFAFIDFLGEKFNFSQETVKDLKYKVDKVGPNTKGFDIEFNEPIKILAEIKCIDSEIGKFSAIQKKNLFIDAYKLKYKESLIDKSDFYKFLVVLDCGNGTDKSIKSFLNYKSVKLNDERNRRMKVLSDIAFLNNKFDFKDLNKDKIYIIKQKL